MNCRQNGSPGLRYCTLHNTVSAAGWLEMKLQERFIWCKQRKRKAAWLCYFKRGQKAKLQAKRSPPSPPREAVIKSLHTRNAGGVWGRGPSAVAGKASRRSHSGRQQGFLRKPTAEPPSEAAVPAPGRVSQENSNRKT